MAKVEKAPRTARLVRDLLRRVVAAGKSERFTLAEICPRDSLRFVGVLHALVGAAYVERISPRCGTWYYALSDKGLELANSDQVPRLLVKFEGD